MSKRALIALSLVSCFATASAQPQVSLPHVTKVHYPFIDLEIDPIPETTRENTFLVDANGTRASATRLERRSVPIDIVFVVNATVAWIRNDVIEQDKRALSGLDLVHQLIASTAWRRHAPEGSTLSLVTYASKASVVLQPTRLAALPAQPIGVAESYNDIVATPSEGIRVAIEHIRHLAARRRLMVVIGDGVASDSDMEKARLSLLASDASAASIDVEAIVYETWATKDAARIIDTFTRHPVVVKDVAEAEAALQKAVDNTVDSYAATFDASSFDWDGTAHQVTFEAAESRLLPVTVLLPDRSPRPLVPIWLWVTIAVVAASVGALVVLRGRH